MRIPVHMGRNARRANRPKDVHIATDLAEGATIGSFAGDRLSRALPGTKLDRGIVDALGISHDVDHVVSFRSGTNSDAVGNTPFSIITSRVSSFGRSTPSSQEGGAFFRSHWGIGTPADLNHVLDGVSQMVAKANMTRDELLPLMGVREPEWPRAGRRSFVHQYFCENRRRAFVVEVNLDSMVQNFDPDAAPRTTLHMIVFAIDGRISAIQSMTVDPSAISELDRAGELVFLVGRVPADDFEVTYFNSGNNPLSQVDLDETGAAASVEPEFIAIVTGRIKAIADRGI